MSGALAGKVVLVTGAGGGIGAPVARHLGAAGADVAVSELAAERAEKVAVEIVAAGGSAIAVAGDVSEEADVTAMFDAAVDRFGRIDGVVHLATCTGNGPLLEFPLDRFDRIVAVNLRGVLLVGRTAARHMIARQAGGSLVLFSSVTSLYGAPGQAIYGMTKAGLQGLIKSMAIEWAPHRIRVNGLSPTTTDTPLARDWLDSDPTLRDTIARSVPLGRLAEPEDFFGTLELLLGDGARFITGQTIFVDGGVSVTHPLIKR